MSSYKPYPSSGKPVAPERGPAPQSVLNAVKLMYAGAAVSTVSLIVSLTGTGSLKSTIRSHYPHYTTSQVNHLYGQIIEAAIVSSVFGILLWLVMAWANGKGMSWARIAACVLFGFNTIGLIAFFRQPETGLSLVFEVLVWLVGLGAIILLWRPESNAYFKPQNYVLSVITGGCSRSTPALPHGGQRVRANDAENKDPAEEMAPVPGTFSSARSRTSAGSGLRRAFRTIWVLADPGRDP